MGNQISNSQTAATHRIYHAPCHAFVCDDLPQQMLKRTRPAIYLHYGCLLGGCLMSEEPNCHGVCPGNQKAGTAQWRTDSCLRSSLPACLLSLFVWLVGWLVGWLVVSSVRWLVRSFACLFVCLFVCWLVRSFVCLLNGLFFDYYPKFVCVLGYSWLIGLFRFPLPYPTWSATSSSCLLLAFHNSLERFCPSTCCGAFLASSKEAQLDSSFTMFHPWCHCLDTECVVDPDSCSNYAPAVEARGLQQTHSQSIAWSFIECFRRWICMINAFQRFGVHVAHFSIAAYDGGIFVQTLFSVLQSQFATTILVREALI